jgi:hypothetical protein
MCTELLPPGVFPITVKKYISYIIIIIIIILLTAIGLSPGGSTQSHTTIRSTTQIKIHRTTQLEREKQKRMWKSAGRAPSKNASFTLAFALHLRRKHEKTSVREIKNLSQVKKTSVITKSTHRLRKTSVIVSVLPTA